MTGFISTWLPLQQEHATGREALFDLFRGDIHRGRMWTDANFAPGDLAMSPWQTLPAGDYTAVLQIFHSGQKGLRVGTLIAEADGPRSLAEQEVTTHGQDFGDWQRVLVAFQLAAPTRVRVRLRYDGRHPLWTGTLHLTRSGPRPIYVIGHNRNTVEQVDRSLELGANAIEGDFSYRDGRLMVAETPPWPGFMETTDASVWLRHLWSRRDRWAFVYLDCKTDSTPNKDYYRFGRELAERVRDAGIDPRVCLFNVPDAQAKDLFRGVADAGFGASPRCIDGLERSSPEGGPPTAWAEEARKDQLQVLGLGRPNWDPTTAVARWWEPLRATVTARDTGSYPKKVIYWSLDDKDSMRKLLDLGMDGLIVDHEDRLCQVLEEEPYRRFCRRAKPNEWAPFQAHGIDG